LIDASPRRSVVKIGASLGGTKWRCEFASPIQTAGESWMPSRDEIFEKVKETLVDALGLDDDEVTATSRLKADLGAESIDFLDIVFRLEKNFGIKIPRNELFPESLFTADSGFAENGRVTDKGLEELRTRLPHADKETLDALAKDPRVENVEDLFTVNMVVNFLTSKLAA
jgi:acyl carrier protein